MQETGLNQLAEAVGNRKDMNTIGPAFESFQDPLFTEMIKNLKSYQQERRELLTRYTRDHEKVKLVEEKIDDVNSYLREAISMPGRTSACAGTNSPRRSKRPIMRSTIFRPKKRTW